jgi:hypothetical protein
MRDNMGVSRLVLLLKPEKKVSTLIPAFINSELVIITMIGCIWETNLLEYVRLQLSHQLPKEITIPPTFGSTIITK